MPKIRDRNLETYSEEVQEIMGYIPKWIVRWGITVFFGIFMMLVVGSYFFKYPIVVSTPFVLTTINPPAPLISKSSGRIGRWYVSDGQDVYPGEVVAILYNTASYDDLKLINQLLSNLSGNWVEEVETTTFPSKLSLGKLQNTFVNFQKTFNNLKHYLKQDLTGKKMILLKSRISSEESQYELLLKQWDLKEKEYELAQSIYSRDSLAYFKGGYGIIVTDYERSLQTFLGQKSSMLSFKSSLKKAEISLLQLKESLLELKLAKESDLNTFNNTLDEARVSLLTQIDDWFNDYVMTSPIEGNITLTNYWSENQVINTGERLATIVPKEETVIIARAFISSSGLGKVQIGQKVNIKLTGFPYLEYGVLTGRVGSISLVPDDEGYVAEIELSDGMTSTYSENLKFVQEMDGIADIITKETRLIYRLIYPLKMVINNQ